MNLLAAHQDRRYDERGFSDSVRFDPGQAGRGLSLDVTAVFGAAAQGAGRLWAAQDMGGLTPYGAAPFDIGGQLAAAVGYGTAGPWGRGAGRPYAGLTRSGTGRRAVRYGYRWEVGPRFNVGVEAARMGGFGGLAKADDRGGGPAHSVQVRGGSGSERIGPGGMGAMNSRRRQGPGLEEASRTGGRRLLGSP